MLLITLQEEEEEEGVDVAEEEEDTWEAEVRHLSLYVLLFGILFHSIINTYILLVTIRRWKGWWKRQGRRRTRRRTWSWWSKFVVSQKEWRHCSIFW